ncbi:50S ribosomal protein L30 [Pontibacter diazotrophicus]|uniref:Large ribosomal subunit protein uL30 n=1 Tax=Pontibacter diazotrophicus TaxID=1400979 RepID=A0A3D8LCS1_9BACT|nr:50S ribosomal protein L30 [Pontibacter diazotrophicus]RDV15205.1 50S ribosomal protein L30 [Pontibacter diazotrophicus]
MAKVTITQVKSIIGRPQDQKATMKALGLGKISRSVSVENTPQIAGMIKKVHSLVEVKDFQ